MKKENSGGAVDESSPASVGDMGLPPVQEDSTGCGVTKPVCPHYRACMSLSHALEQEKPPEWEACAPQLKSSYCSLQLEEVCT